MIRNQRRVYDGKKDREYVYTGFFSILRTGYYSGVSKRNYYFGKIAIGYILVTR